MICPACKIVFLWRVLFPVASTMIFIYSGIQVAHYVNSKFSLLLKLFWFAALSFCPAFLFFTYYERGITYEQIINNLLICKTYIINTSLWN